MEAPKNFSREITYARMHSCARDIFGDRKLSEEALRAEAIARFGIKSLSQLTDDQLFELDRWIAGESNE